MGGVQSQVTKTNQVINDVVQVNQNTVFSHTSTASCGNAMQMKGCSITGSDFLQQANCVSDVSSYQRAVQTQSSQNTLSNELLNKIQQSTQNASLNLTYQQQKTINDLKINMATDIQQSIVMDCNETMFGLNTVSCDQSNLSMVHLDQELAMKQTSKCVQDAAQNSVAAQDLKNIVSNIVSQKQQNALLSMAAVILAVGCVCAVFFLGPGAEVGNISKDMMKQPAGILMLTFICVMCVGFCHAITESKSHCFSIGKFCTCPPSIPDKYWQEVWIATFIYVVSMLSFAYFEAKKQK